jgi:uncharacterized protein YndB with AHSA1/START domain
MGLIPMSAVPAILPPLFKTISVPWTPDRAFHRFTAELASWWPLQTHSVGGARARRCGFEPREGGTVFEECADGSRSVWGTVTVWEPPGRVAFTWHPARTPESAQLVEVRFVPEGSGTRLELTHTGWEKLGADARKARRAYPLGWTYVLNCYAGRGRSPTNLMLDAVIGVMQLLQRFRKRSRP